MDKLKETRWVLTLILIGLFISSCQKNKLEETLLTVQSETDVSIELATTVAKNFVYDQAFFQRSSNDLKNSSLRTLDFKSDQKIKEITIAKSFDDLLAFYVVEFDPEGFVIVAGNRKETPILAFSENGCFEYDPSTIESTGLHEWIETIKKKIAELRNNPLIEVADSIEEQWDYMAPPEDDEIVISGGTVYEQKGPYLSTSWNQGIGYNEEAPFCNCAIPGNGKAFTGCVATATAQVMKFWEYPSSYNWNEMPNNTGCIETSKLMRDIADEVDMNWGCYSEGGSGAVTSKVRNALVSKFGYSNEVKYTIVNFNTIVTQLNYGWPVIMRGREPDNSGGHTWVCDGYKRNRHITIHNPGTYYEYETSTISSYYLQMNWGWGGTSDGWYLYNDMTPGDNNLNRDRYIIINIHP